MYIYIFIHILTFLYLKCTQRRSVYWLIPQILAVSGAGPNQGMELNPDLRMWVAGTQVLESSLAYQGVHQQEAVIGSGTGTLIWSTGVPRDIYLLLCQMPALKQVILMSHRNFLNTERKPEPSVCHSAICPKLAQKN